MRSCTVVLATVLSLFSMPPARAQAPAGKVVVITLDGLRWQEFFTGADRDYFKKEKDGAPGAAEKRFWRETPAERRATLMPFVWGTIGDEGSNLRRPVEEQPVSPDQRPVVLVSRLQRNALGRRRPAGRQ
jgi:hypothetical protein